MNCDHSDGTVAEARLKREFDRIVHKESHAHALRIGTVIDVSSAAWACGFPQEYRVLLTADALRVIRPSHRDANDAQTLTQRLDQRTAQVLTAANRLVRQGPKDEFDPAFAVRFPGNEHTTCFTWRLELFGTRDRSTFVIGWAGTNPDGAPVPL